jgi:hypothetical protein
MIRIKDQSSRIIGTNFFFFESIGTNYQRGAALASDDEASIASGLGDRRCGELASWCPSYGCQNHLKTLHTNLTHNARAKNLQ